MFFKAESKAWEPVVEYFSEGWQTWDPGSHGVVIQVQKQENTVFLLEGWRDSFSLVGDKSFQSLFNSGFQWLGEADIWEGNMLLSAY